MAETKRWLQRFNSFTKALNNLSDAVALKHYSKLEQTGLVQTFNITFELAWKTLRDILIIEGFTINSPRETIKQAYQSNYLTNGELWVDALEKSNLMAHVYDEEQSTAIVKLIIEKYFPILQELHKVLSRKLAT